MKVMRSMTLRKEHSTFDIQNYLTLNATEDKQEFLYHLSDFFKVSPSRSTRIAIFWNRYWKMLKCHIKKNLLPFFPLMSQKFLQFNKKRKIDNFIEELTHKTSLLEPNSIQATVISKQFPFLVSSLTNLPQL